MRITVNKFTRYKPMHEQWKSPQTQPYMIILNTLNNQSGVANPQYCVRLIHIPKPVTYILCYYYGALDNARVDDSYNHTAITAM